MAHKWGQRVASLFSERPMVEGGLIVGTRLDWLSVLILTLLWTISTLTWGYIRRRKHHMASLGTVPWSKRFGAYLMIVFIGFDFGYLTTFWIRAFHGDLLVVLIGANIGLAAVMIGFRPLSPDKTS